jgi:hypothetical protein
MRLRAYDQIARIFVDDKHAESKEQSQAAGGASSAALTSSSPGIRFHLTQSPAFQQFTNDLFVLTVRASPTLSDAVVSGSTIGSCSIQYPHLLALLLTKIGGEIFKRLPVLLLEPMLASSDPLLREATAHVWKRACFLAQRVNHRVVHQLLLVVSKLMVRLVWCLRCAYV